MRKISYERFFDKVYGCFLGKCIGGTAGGPAEGRKELMDAPLDEAILHSVLPNDDLDLQIIWLELLEEMGSGFTARDMAREFYNKIPYGPGEYGYAKRNYAAGIYPPTSGKFNNAYYKNGMGCPIRSEIWACLFPGAWHLARHYAEMDGSIDHERDSIDAEHFLVKLEAEAFFADGYGDLIQLIEESLAVIPEGSRIRAALSDTLSWYREGRDWKNVRGLILRHYGHPDCTNLYQNMAFILLVLLFGKGEFRETIRLSLAVGYDTDCIAATAASVLGIFRGARSLLDEDGMTDTGLSIGVGTRRKTGSIEQLSRDVCAAAISLSYELDGATEILDHPEVKPLPKTRIPEFYVNAEYIDEPILYPTRPTKVLLHVKRNYGTGECKVSFAPPSGVGVDATVSGIELNAGEECRVEVSVFVEKGAPVLRKSNIIKLKINEHEDDFGLMGAVVWRRFGPFLMNNADLVETVPAHIPYGKFIPVPQGCTSYDTMRDFHLNLFADPDRCFVDESEPFLDIKSDGRAQTEPHPVYTGTDPFDIAKIQSFMGPHTDYLVTTLISPEERSVELALGHTAPFKLWVNGTLVGRGKECTWWTCENKHISVKLNKGENTVILKCSVQGGSAEYSIIPRVDDFSWIQYSDIDCALYRGV